MQTFEVLKNSGCHGLNIIKVDHPTIVMDCDLTKRITDVTCASKDERVFVVNSYSLTPENIKKINEARIVYWLPLGRKSKYNYVENDHSEMYEKIIRCVLIN